MSKGIWRCGGESALAAIIRVPSNEDFGYASCEKTPSSPTLLTVEHSNHSIATERVISLLLYDALLYISAQQESEVHAPHPFPPLVSNAVRVALGTTKQPTSIPAFILTTPWTTDTYVRIAFIPMK